MTRIKCRYSIPYCSYHGKHERVYHNEYWWCDTDEQCIDGVYTPPPDSNVINPTCTWCGHYVGEFEKTVKRYEFENGDLKVGGSIYYLNEIEYLEIDGRILIGEVTTDD